MRLAAAFFLGSLLAGAQILTPVLMPSPASGSSYAGPGDVVSGAVFYWGLRAYSAATAGGIVANICNSGDANCADVHTLANGNFDVSTATGSPLSCGGGGGTCTIKILYEQLQSIMCGPVSAIQACDMVQNTIASRPTLVISGSLAWASFNGSQRLSTVNKLITDIAQPYTVSMVTERTGNLTGQSDILFSAAFIAFDYWSTADTFRFYAGINPVTVPATSNAIHAMQFLGNGASSIGYVDGVSNSINPGSQTFNNGGNFNLFVGSTDTTPNLTGTIRELGVWPAGFTTPQLSSMNSNQHTYWGF